MLQSSSQHEADIIYLDHAAATPLTPAVLKGHAERCARFFYNPHSTHQFSEECMRAIMCAESDILSCVGLTTREAGVIWTSGGTEANNLGILGCLREQRPGLCAVEASGHSSVLAPAQRYGAESGHGRCIEIPVDSRGQVQLDAIAPEVARGDLRLVAVCHVNNETGVIQNLVTIREWLDINAPGAYLLVDALQSFGKLDIAWREAGIDMLTIGGRKLGGPAHVGALIVRKGTPLRPLLFGGGQQNELRPGTMDTVGIVEFALAATHVRERMFASYEHVARLNATLRDELRQLDIAETILITPDDGSPHILSFACKGYEGAILMRLLAERGIIVATGSACSAESGAVSHVLKAMRLSRQTGRAAVRVSLSPTTTAEDIQTFVTQLRHVLKDY